MPCVRCRRRWPSPRRRRVTAVRLPAPGLGCAGRPGHLPTDPQAVFGTESLAQTLRQLEIYGRDGLPVLSPDDHQIQGWITAPAVLRAIASQITTARAATAQAQVAADWEHADPDSLLRHPPTPLPGYQVAEITITAGSPAAGRKLGDVTWPRASAPVSVLRGYQLRPPRPEITLAAGDRVSLLTGAPAAHRRTLRTAATPSRPVR